MFQAYPHRGHLKAEIVARVGAGETLVGIGAEPGMPCAGSIQVWRRGDPQFAAALAAARARGAWRRRLMFDEAVAAAFLARVAAGEKINDLLGRPGMPSQRAYAYWRRTQIGFQEALWRLRQGRYATRSGSGHMRWRAWDPAMADRIQLAVMRGAVLRRLLASDPALPCLAVVERWRREHRDWDAGLRIAMKAGRLARGRARTWRSSPALLGAIADRIVTGASLRSLGAEPDMPCSGTLYAWVARWPAFEREVLAACDWREDWYNDQMVDTCQRNGPFALSLTKWQVAPLQKQVNRLAKRPGWKRRREARAEMGMGRSDP